MRRRILRTPQAAAYVGLAARTLEKKRLSKDGPEFVRLGKRAVGYDVRALDDWLDGQRRGQTPQAKSAEQEDRALGGDSLAVPEEASSEEHGS